MLIDRYKLAKADAVLAAISGITLEDEEKRLHLGTYSNGREQGYHVHSLDNQRAASFSENRNSDDIVVYLGLHQFFHDGHPDENVYNNRKYFDSDAYEEAAEWIINYIIKGET